MKPPEIMVSPMELAHLDDVHAIEERSFSVPWSRKDLLKEITENKHALYKVALLDGKVLGYAGMWHIVNEGHINNIAVDEPFRRMGVGSRLLEALIAEARTREMAGLTLEVRVGNGAAQRLYHKYGFKPEGLRKNYYTDTREDAVIMWKHL